MVGAFNDLSLKTWGFQVSLFWDRVTINKWIQQLNNNFLSVNMYTCTCTCIMNRIGASYNKNRQKKDACTDVFYFEDNRTVLVKISRKKYNMQENRPLNFCFDDKLVYWNITYKTMHKTPDKTNRYCGLVKKNWPEVYIFSWSFVKNLTWEVYLVLDQCMELD